MRWKGIAWFAARPRLRAALAWAAVLIAAAVASYLAWVGYDEPGRPERTVGHIYIDFSGQWIMGRMLARGEGPYLYDRERVGECSGRPTAGGTARPRWAGSSRRPTVRAWGGRFTRRSRRFSFIRWACCRP